MAILAGIHFTFVHNGKLAGGHNKNLAYSHRSTHKCYTQKEFLHPCPSFYCNNQILEFYHFSCWDILCMTSFSSKILQDCPFQGLVSWKASIFLGKKANFKIKTCWIVVHFLAHKLVNFALLTDSFILSFSK